MKTLLLFLLLLLPCLSQAAARSPGDTLPRFKLDSARVDSAAGEILFFMRDERDSLLYTVQQFRWGKWLDGDKVYGKRKKEPTIYTAGIKLHGGLNKFRIVVKDGKTVTDSSAVIEWKPRNYTSIDNWHPRYFSNEVDLPCDCEYMLYDQYGSVVQKGKGTTIDTRKVPRGGYFLDMNGKVYEIYKM